MNHAIYSNMDGPEVVILNEVAQTEKKKYLTSLIRVI